MAMELEREAIKSLDGETELEGRLGTTNVNTNSSTTYCVSEVISR